MELYLSVILDVEDKSAYLGEVFPFFIHTMNEATVRYHKYKQEQLDSLEDYKKQLVLKYELWCFKLLQKCMHTIL